MESSPQARNWSGEIALNSSAWRQCFVPILIFIAISAVAEVSEARKGELIAAYGKTGATFRADQLIAEDRDFFRSCILSVGINRPGASPDTFETQLLQLSHEPTIQKYGMQIKEGWMSTIAAREARQPRLIEFYEPQLLLNEPAWEAQLGDTTAWRASVRAAAGMLMQLRESLEVPLRVRDWAGR